MVTYFPIAFALVSAACCNAQLHQCANLSNAAAFSDPTVLRSVVNRGTDGVANLGQAAKQSLEKVPEFRAALNNSVNLSPIVERVSLRVNQGRQGLARVFEPVRVMNAALLPLRTANAVLEATANRSTDLVCALQGADSVADMVPVVMDRLSAALNGAQLERIPLAIDSGLHTAARPIIGSVAGLPTLARETLSEVALGLPCVSGCNLPTRIQEGPPNCANSHRNRG